MPDIAYDVGLRPWEYDRLTPVDFDRIWAAYQRHLDREMYRAAWMVSWLLAPHRKRGSRPLTPEKLLGLPPKKKPGTKPK